MREGKGEGGKGKEKWKNEEACNEERKTNVKEKKQRKDERERKTNTSNAPKSEIIPPQSTQNHLFTFFSFYSHAKKNYK